MKTYCVGCKKNTANGNSSLRKTKEYILMILPNYSVTGKRRSMFIKNKELH